MTNFHLSKFATYQCNPETYLQHISKMSTTGQEHFELSYLILLAGSILYSPNQSK